MNYVNKEIAHISGAGLDNLQTTPPPIGGLVRCPETKMMPQITASMRCFPTPPLLIFIGGTAQWRHASQTPNKPGGVHPCSPFVVHQHKGEQRNESNTSRKTIQPVQMPHLHRRDEKPLVSARNHPTRSGHLHRMRPRAKEISCLAARQPTSTYRGYKNSGRANRTTGTTIAYDCYVNYVNLKMSKLMKTWLGMSAFKDYVNYTNPNYTNKRMAVAFWRQVDWAIYRSIPCVPSRQEGIPLSGIGCRRKVARRMGAETNRVGVLPAILSQQRSSYE
jgi:hypothetical protein